MSGQGVIEGGHPRQHYSLTFAILALGGGAYAALQSLVAPALPAIQRDLHVSANGVAWILTAYLLSASVLTPIIGRLGDMFGKEHTLVAVLVGLGVGTLVAALSSSLPPMLAGRVIQGAGGAIFPLAFGIIRDEFPRERGPQGIALMSAIIGIGGGLGIVLAGPIVDALSYHWLFWMPLVLVVIATVATVFFIPESPVKSPGTINWAGAALLSAWLVCVLLGLSEGPTWGWGSVRTLGLLVLGVVLLGVWIANEQRATEPLVDMAMMRIRGVWTVNLTAFMVGGGDVQLVHPHSRVRRDAPQRRLRVRRLGHPGRALPASVHRGHAHGESAGRPPGLGRRRAHPARARLHRDDALVRHARRRALVTVGDLCRRRPAGGGDRPGLRLAGQPHRRRVEPSQTGVATGMNTVMRSLGGSVGSTIGATVLTGSLLASGLPREHGFTLAFWVAAAACGLAVLASLIVSARPGRHAQSAPEREPVAALSRPRRGLQPVRRGLKPAPSRPQAGPSRPLSLPRR